LSQRLTGWVVAEFILKTLVLFFCVATLFVASVNATTRLAIDTQSEMMTAIAFSP
jgi:uncharacterized protein (UPF0333 family)